MLLGIWKWFVQCLMLWQWNAVMRDNFWTGRWLGCRRGVGVLFWLATVLVLVACGGGGPDGQPSSNPPINPRKNTPPFFTSLNSVTVLENSTVVTRVTASDAENNPITFSLTGGVDWDRFDIDGQTGELRFKHPVDFEAPGDRNLNNYYLVEVTASDGISKIWKNWYVTVTGVRLKVEVKPSFIKTLSFSWNPFSGSTYYKLLVSPDGESGYTQVGTDMTTTHADVIIPVHMTDWINSRYVVEGYNGEGLVFRSDSKEMSSFELDTIGYVKALSTDVEDRFGERVALSADGQTLAVGVSGEDSAATGIGGNQDDDSANNAGAVYVYARGGAVWTQQGYIKASNTNADDQFGTSIALSADGQTLVVGATRESSVAKGVDGNQSDNTANRSGAVYVYERVGLKWTQQAYIKASNTGEDDRFGVSVALSADGQTLVVGAQGEASGATGIDGNQQDNSAVGAGAVYVYTRSGSAWTQQAYIKASNTDAFDFFGVNVALSADGQTLAVGAWGEDSAVNGVNRNQLDNTAEDAGAVYLFTREGAVWTQQAFVKASNAEGANFDTGDFIGDSFGQSVALSADGQSLAVGALFEDSAATGVEGDQRDNTAINAGSVYVYARMGEDWSQQAYIKASNADTEELFGISVAMSAEGQTLIVGAWGESSIATGIAGDQGDNTADNAGAAYVYAREGTAWTQQAYVKAPNTDKEDYYGTSVTLSADGQTLVVGAPGEASAATGIDGDQVNNEVSGAGAVFLY